MDFSQASSLPNGNLEYTVTLDAEMPDLSSASFRVVFTGEFHLQYRVDYVVPDAVVAVRGDGLERTVEVTPPENSKGNLSLVYAADDAHISEVDSIWSSPHEIDTTEDFTDIAEGPSGQQSQGCQGIRGSETHYYVLYRNGTSRPSAGSGSYNYRTNSVRLPSGWSQSYSTPSSNQNTYMQIGRVVIFYCGPSASDRSSASGWRSGCVVLIPRGATGSQGCQGCRGLTGSRGPTGPRGATGATGATGPQGDKGDTGSRGPTGPRGSIGATGSQGCQGCQGCRGLTGSRGPTGATGSMGLRAPTYYPFVFYTRATRTPTRPTRGSFSFLRTSTASITSHSGWSLTPPTSVSDNQNIYSLQAWGVVHFNNVGNAVSSSLQIGCVTLVPRGCRGLTGARGSTGSQGCQGCRGLTGSRGATGPTGGAGPRGCCGTESVPFLFYRTLDRFPDYPSSGDTSFNATTRRASVRNWSTSSPSSVPSNQDLYVLSAWGIINYNAAGTASSGGLRLGCIYVVPRGCRGLTGPRGATGGTGSRGVQGPCGTKVEQFRLYARSATSPSTSGIGYNTSGDLTLTSSARNIWKLDRGDTQGSNTEWILDVYGYLNYSSTGTVTATHCIFGPFQVGSQGCQGLQGCRGLTGSTGPRGSTGATGARGPCGTNVEQFRLYTRRSSTPSTSGIGYNASGNLTLTSSARNIWTEDRSTLSGTQTEWILDVYGYLNYATDGTVTPTHCIYGPFQVGSQGCQGCDGVHGTDQFISVFYQAKSGLAPTAPPSARFNGSTISNTGSWSATAPTNYPLDQSLYVIYGYGVTSYSSTNVASYSVRWSCVFVIPRGCTGQRGAQGCGGTRVFQDVRYARSNATPSTSNISFNTSEVFSYPTQWKATLAETTGNETAWEVTVIGYINYTTGTAVASHCIFGPVQVGSQGVQGCRGIHGTSTGGDIFYRRSVTTPPKPNDPARSASGYTTTPPTGWFATPTAARAASTSGDLYYLFACCNRTYTPSGTSCYQTCYEEPIVIPRGCQGERGVRGYCGTCVVTIVLYRRSATIPPVTGVTYGAGGFTYPSWHTSIPSGTDPTWTITVYGYTNYSSGGTTYSHYIAGPTTVGAAGSPGSPGIHGTSSYAKTYYLAKSGAAPSAPISATWNGSVFAGVGAWVETPPTLTTGQNLYVVTGYGHTTYNAANVATYSTTWSCPYLVPRGCMGEDGDSSDVAWIYRRSASAPPKPVFDASDSTTGTWDQTTFVPPTDWTTTIPAGSDTLFISAAVLKGDNSIDYGCVITIPSQTGSGSTTSCPITYPDVLIDRTCLLLGNDGMRLPPNAVVPAPSGIVQNPTLGITFLWSEAVRGFTTGDVRLLNFSCTNAVATLTWPSNRPTQGTTWSATLNLPANTTGEVEISVPVGAAESTRVAGAHGPQVERLLRIRYNTVGVGDTTAPTVNVSYSAYASEIWFRWSEPVNDFTADDITFASTPTIAKGTLTQDDCVETLYRMPITVPVNANPIDLTVTIAANAVTDEAGNNNLVHTEVVSLTPRSNVTSVPSGTTLIWSVDQPFNQLHWLDTVLSRRPSGGAFMGVTDLIQNGDYLYGVAQVMHVRDTNTSQLARNREAGGAIFRVNLTSKVGTIVKAYTNYTQAARSLANYQNDVYWFEGSGYNYVNGQGHAVDDKIGIVRSQTPVSGCQVDRGLNFRSKLGRENATGGFDDHYGRHGGTVSPMRTRADDLLLVSGFGNFQLMNDSSSDVADLDNWTMIQYSNNVPLLLPTLQTNDKTGWDIISEIARITNSIIGFDGARLVFQPRGILKATLTETLTASGTTLSFNQGSIPLPQRGLLLVDDELIEYTFNIV